MGYQNISNSNNKWDIDVYWDAPYGSSSAYVYWTVNENGYGRTFNLVQRSNTSNRYNSGSTVAFGEYCMYVYKNGSYSQQSEWIDIQADAPPTYTVSYNNGGRGTAPSSQSATSGSSITLRGKMSNVAGTSYTVSYNANGGSSTPSSSTSTYTYTHTKWAKGSTSGTQYNPSSSYTVTGNTTMYGIWSGSRAAVTLPAAISRSKGTATRTVTFDANGGSCSTTSLSSTASITYTFNGWGTSSSSTSGTAAGASYTPSGNVTLYATWSSSTGSYSAITLPTATRTGYDFKGWSTSSTASSGSTGSYTPTGSVTLYATWAKKTYAVSYNANGHGTAPSAQTKTHDTALTLQAFISNQTGTGYTVSYNANGGSTTPSASAATTLTYTQTNWNTKSDGSGTNYASKGSYTSNAAATMYAIWSSSSSSMTLASAITRDSSSETGYTVTFDANGGTCSTTSLTSTKTRSYSFNKWAAGSTSGTKYSAGASFTPTANTTMYATWTESVTNNSITLPTPTRTGYTFKGWSTSSSATSGSTGSYTPTAATTLYATWQINTWTVNYNANGHGTAPSSQTKTYGQALTLRSFIAQQTGTGYTVSFNKNGGSTTPNSQTSTIYYDQTYWNTNSSGTGTNYGSAGSYTNNSGATLYAIWSTTNGSITLPAAITRADSTETGYKVTFNANGGSCSTTDLTATNTRKYTFSKWAAGSTSGTKYNAGAAFAPSGNTTMYATWTESVTNGSITLPTATRSGYSFKGWSTSQSATTGTTGSYTPTGNVTMYAVWSANSYSISYNANGYGTAPAGQSKIHDTALTLQPFIADQSTTGYKVSFNANGGKTTPSDITSTILKKQTYWNTNSSGTGTNYSSKGSYTANSAATLYAIWGSTNQAITLPAAIEKDSSSKAVWVELMNSSGTSVWDPRRLYRVTPYTFDKWAVGSINGTKYSAGASYTPSSAATMFATWTAGAATGTLTLPAGEGKANTTANGYTITLDGNGIEAQTSSLVAQNIVRWTFTSWNDRADGSGTSYNANEDYAFDEDVVLYPQYSSSIAEYGTVNLPSLTRKNYTFKGWSTDKNATSGFTTYTPTSDTTLYAVWEMNNSLIHYNNNGVDTLCCVYYNDNGTAVLCNVYYNNNGTAVRI